MIKQDVAQRYSKVLFQLDLEKDYLKNRLKDFEYIVALVKKNPEFNQILSSPQITLEKKKEFLERTVKPVLDSDFRDFILYLIKRKRWDYLEPIANKYRNLVNEHLGIWEAEMIVAESIKPELENRLIDKLEKLFKKKIKVNKKIQPEIIGGTILIVENTMIDWSITGRLRKIKESLLERKT